MKKNTSDLRTIVDINVTPLVDVCLVLVIIFMVTMPMLLQPMAKVNLPVASTALEERKDVVFVSLTAENKIVMDRKDVGLEDLASELKSRLALSAAKVVIIRADKMIHYGLLKRMVTTAKDSGAKKIVFATDLKSKHKNP